MVICIQVTIDSLPVTSDELHVVATPPLLEAKESGDGDSAFLSAVLCYHLFGVAWVLQFIQAFITISMGNAAHKAYNATDKDGDGKADIDKTAVPKGIWTTIRYHSGSAAIGAFALTFARPLKIPFTLLSKLESGDTSGAVGKFTNKILQCVSFCYSKVLVYISSSAYVVIAVDGDSFFPAAWRVFKLHLTCAQKVDVVQASIDTLTSLTIGAISGMQRHRALALLVGPCSRSWSCTVSHPHPCSEGQRDGGVSANPNRSWCVPRRGHALFHHGGHCAAELLVPGGWHPGRLCRSRWAALTAPARTCW
jgi:hypothetical protein